MKTFYKDQIYYLELAIIDISGNFVTSFESGEEVTYIIKKSSDGSTIASGEMIIDGNVWKCEWTPTIVDEYRIEYTTPAGYEDGIETLMVEDYDNYKADISNLALEATAQDIKNKTDNLPADPASETGVLAKDSTVAKEAQATLNKEEIITEIDDNEIKIDAIKTEEDLIKIEVDKIQSDIIDDKDSYKADVSSLATETNLNTKASQESVDDVKEDTESIISFLATLISNIWTYVTRTLTSGGAITPEEVWEYNNRTLTAGTKDAEIDAIKIETDKIKYILGLSQENYKLTDIVHNVLNEITSAKIKSKSF